MFYIKQAYTKIIRSKFYWTKSYNLIRLLIRAFSASQIDLLIKEAYQNADFIR